MRKTRAFLCLLTAFIYMLPALAFAGDAASLLTNGGFERLTPAGEPVDWYATAYRNQEGYSRIAVTDAKAHTGRYSALVENASLNDARFTCAVKVEPESLYRLSGYVLVDGMGEEGNGANLAIEDIYAFSDRFYDTAGEWKYVEWYGETGENQTEITLGVRVGGYGAESVGKAYFDDIALEKVDALPQGVVASIWYSTRQEAPQPAVEEDAAAEKSTVLFVLCALAFALLFMLSKPLLEKKDHRRTVFVFAALLAVALAGRIVIACSVPGYQVDINCFTAWSMRMADVGPAGFYLNGYFCDYPPGYLLLLWPCGILLNAVGYTNTPAALLIVKAIPILCDMLGAIWLFAFAKKRVGNTAAAFVAGLYALNPAVLVNGAAWGQVDSVLALLMLLTACFAMERNWRAALPLFVISMLMKPQALLFAPIGGIWLIMCLFQKQDAKERAAQWKNVGIGLGIAIAAALAIAIPFSIRQINPVGWLFKLYSDTLSSYAFATLNTANLYYIAGANWVALSRELPAVLPALTALALGVFGLYLLLGGRAKGKPFQWKEKRTLIALLSFAVALVQFGLWVFSGTYSAYGYVMMAYAFAYAILCLLFDGRAESLPFYMAMALVGVYVLGVKVHERYLFPALPLLLMGYAATRDRRLLWLCVGFSATTFVNTAIVLDNSILFGSAQGHLNMDTHGLNMVLSVANLLLCGFAGWIGLSGVRQSKLEPASDAQPEADGSIPASYRNMLLSPKDARLHLSARDWLIMGVTTVLYAVLAFANLGSTVAPQDGWVSTSSQEQVTFELDQPQTFSVLYYAGVSYNSFSISVSEDGINWFNAFPCEMREGLCYRWNYALQSEEVDGKVQYADNAPDGVLWLTGKYLRINAEQAGLNLFEIVARDQGGNQIPLKLFSHTGANADLLSEAKPADRLINEQDTCVGEPGWYNGTYFDEIYHARTAYEHLHGQKPYETTHPPLGKLMMSVGISIFGMTPFGWRFAGALVGVLMLPALYLFALQLSKKRDVATFSILAFALDLMHYAQTRIATIDSFPVLFIILSYLCMARYLQFDVFAVPEGDRPRLLNRTYWKSLIPLALSGLFMGLSIASKWIGIYSAAGLAILFFLAIYRQYRASNIACGMDAADDSGRMEPERKRILGAQEFTLKRILITCGFCVGFFILVPCVIYYLSYIPYLSPTGPVTLRRIIAAQEGMLSYHSTPGLGMDHPFQSPWWQWPLIMKPMWFSQDKFEPAGYASTIMCMGNPWVFYIGAVCMVAVFAAFIAKYVRVKTGLSLRHGDGDLTLAVLVIGMLAQYLPWVLVPRSMYIYHYFASVPFVILATAWMLNLLPESRPKLRHGVMALYVIGAAAFFVMFFPYASGWLTRTEWLDAMKWFSKLYY